MYVRDLPSYLKSRWLRDQRRDVQGIDEIGVPGLGHVIAMKPFSE